MRPLSDSLAPVYSLPTVMLSSIAVTEPAAVTRSPVPDALPTECTSSPTAVAPLVSKVTGSSPVTSSPEESISCSTATSFVASVPTSVAS